MTRFTEDMNIISKLGDNPNVDNNLSAADLKEKFDEGGKKVKDFLNNILIEEIENSVAAKGDMRKSVYDTNGDGIIDHAALADTATTAAKATTADTATKATQDKNGKDITTEYAKATHTHTPASIGAAAATHTHSGANITSGTAYNVLGIKQIVAGPKENPTIADIPNDGDVYLVI